jgi:hypothetical protein
MCVCRVAMQSIRQDRDSLSVGVMLLAEMNEKTEPMVAKGSYKVSEADRRYEIFAHRAKPPRAGEASTLNPMRCSFH